MKEFDVIVVGGGHAGCEAAAASASAPFLVSFQSPVASAAALARAAP